MASSPNEFALPLKGKIALVTGASRGIGAGIALEFAKRGATVIATFISPSSEEKVKKIQEELQSLPHKPEIHPLRVDLSTLEGAKTVFEDLKAWKGDDFKVDILVNNAGLERVKTLAELSVEDYDAVYNLNVRAPILLTQALLPHLPANSRIINISSVGSRSPFAKLGLYCSSKAAIEGLTRVWAAELGGNGTTVNVVSPGPVQSELLDNIPKEIVEMQKKQTPIQNRLGTVEEVATIVAFLAGPDSAWVTGQVISASGGWAMY